MWGDCHAMGYRERVACQLLLGRHGRFCNPYPGVATAKSRDDFDKSFFIGHSCLGRDVNLGADPNLREAPCGEYQTLVKGSVCEYSLEYTGSAHRVTKVSFESIGRDI